MTDSTFDSVYEATFGTKPTDDIRVAGRRLTDTPHFSEINNPAHYTEGRKYEPIRVIEDWELDYFLGNVVKYISRAGRKGDALTDLKKARFYLNWKIETLAEEQYEEESQ